MSDLTARGSAVLAAGTVLLALVACSSGGGGSSPAPQASVTPDGSRIVFTTPDGTVTRTIPLQNQSTLSSPVGVPVTTIVRERATISDDGSHAGIHSLTTAMGPTDTEGGTTSSFRYYGASGQMWTVTAPNDTAYYKPRDPGQRLLTPDGSRILLVSAGAGNTNPQFTVYGLTGNILYQSSTTDMVELRGAQLSPNGKYVLVIGIVKSTTGYGDLVRVTNVEANQAYDFSYDIAVSGPPTISVTPDGRFQISSSTTQAVLPP